MPQTGIVGLWAGRTVPLKRAATGVALVALLLCAGAAAARAGDDDTDEQRSSKTSVYDEMLAIVGFGGGNNIDYSERSPLVVPPTRDLPPPSANVAPPVAGWPQDPDLARKRAKAKEKPKPHQDYVVESSQPLRPGELNVPGIFTGSTGSRPTNADPEAQQVNPAITQPNKPSLFSFNIFNSNKTEYATFTGETPRASLTDPPPGYLTPSPDQPYGVGPEHKQYKVPTVADRVVPGSGTAQGGN